MDNESLDTAPHDEGTIHHAEVVDKQEEEETLNDSMTNGEDSHDHQQSNESIDDDDEESAAGEEEISAEEFTGQEGDLFEGDEEPEEEQQQESEEIQSLAEEENTMDNSEHLDLEEPANEESEEIQPLTEEVNTIENPEHLALEEPANEEESVSDTGPNDQKSPSPPEQEMKPEPSNLPTLQSLPSIKKKAVKTSQSLLVLPKWRQDMQQKIKDEIEFRNNLKNKYKTEVHGSIDGRLKKVDEIKSMKDSLSKTYTSVKKKAYEPEGKYVPPPKPQKKIEDDKLIFKKRFEYNSTIVKPILHEVSKTAQKVNKERELEKQKKLEEEKKKAALEEEKRKKETEEKRMHFKKINEKKPPISGEELHKRRVEKAKEEKLKLKKKVEIVYPVYNPYNGTTLRERPQSAQVVPQPVEKKPVSVRPQTSQARNHISRTQDKPKHVTKPVEEKRPKTATTSKEKPALVKKTSSAQVSKRNNPSPNKEVEKKIEKEVKLNIQSEALIEVEPHIEEKEPVETNNVSIQSLPDISIEVSQSPSSPKNEQPSITTTSPNSLQIKKEIDDEESYIIDYPTEDCGDESSPLLTDDDADFDLPLSKTPLKEKAETPMASPQLFSLSPTISSAKEQEDDMDSLFIRKVLSEIQSDEEESIAAIQECISLFGNQIFDKGLLSSEDYQTVFSGLHSIKSVKSSIVSDLKASIESKNYDEVFDTSNILMFKSAMLDFLGGLPAALQIVSQNMQTNEVFNYLNTQSQPRDLFFYLLQPVTCLKQQKVKLTELTEVLATDSVNMLLSTVSEIDDYRGDVYLENHTLFKVIELYKDLGMKELMNKKRFLVKEGIFKHETELHEIYLFGDCVVVKAPTKNWLIPFKVIDEIVGDVNVVITKYKEEKTLEIDEHDMEFHMCYQFEDYEDVKSWSKVFTSCFETLV